MFDNFILWAASHKELVEAIFSKSDVMISLTFISILRPLSHMEHFFGTVTLYAQGSALMLSIVPLPMRQFSHDPTGGGLVFWKADGEV
jgi:hypothetical protein